ESPTQRCIMAASPIHPHAASSAGPAAGVTESATSVVQHWIGGNLQRGRGRSLDVFNPATGEVARQVILATTDEVGDAVASAAAAFPAWSDMPPVRRARVLVKYLNLLNEHRDTLAALITNEHGKVFSDAQGEV